MTFIYVLVYICLFLYIYSYIHLHPHNKAPSFSVILFIIISFLISYVRPPKAILILKYVSKISKSFTHFFKGRVKDKR